MSVKIFISGVSDEFRAYREQLRHDLTLPDVEVKIQEDFKDQGRGTLDELDTYISTCDAVVHLVGDITGAVPEAESRRALLDKYPDLAEKLPPLREPSERGEGISYTQWEAWLALYHNKRLLIAKADNGAPRDPKFAPTAASQAAQQAHLGRLRAYGRYPGCTFVTADQLAKYVLSSPILNLLAKDLGGGPSSSVGWLPYIDLLPGLLVLLVTPLVAHQWAESLGVPVGTLLALVLVIAGFALPPVYSRYFLMLGASDGLPGSRDRRGYDTLRDNLATGGPATHLYARWLTAFLDRVDRFFGDAGMADRTLFPHAFGLKTPAPLWTAPAFDRCLLLALLYPVVAVFIIWAVSSHAGPAEQALGLRPIPGWTKVIAMTSIVVEAFAFRQFVRASGWNRIMWAVIGAVAVAVAFGGTTVVAGADAVIGTLATVVAVAFAAAGAFTGAGAVTGAVAFAVVNVVGDVVGIGAFAVAVAVSIAIAGVRAVAGAGIGIAAFAVAFAIAFAFIFAFAFPLAFVDAFAFAIASAPGFAVALAVAVAVAVAVDWLSEAATRNRWQGVFLTSFVAAMVSGCLAAAYPLASSDVYEVVSPLLLFVGLLTLLNAPFDWASLGLTRALLRRGLELKGWWPFGLAVLDALFAAVIVASLALIMVIGVQTFNELGLHGGGSPMLRLVLDRIREPHPELPPLLDGIAAHAEAPQYWWVYALLLSTMIPSLINLAIGGTALMRAIPGLSSALLHFLPATGGVPTYDRAWIAAVLTAQAALGAILGVAVQAFVAWGLIFYAMPAVGLGLLDLARDLTDLNLPMRLIELLADAN